MSVMQTGEALACGGGTHGQRLRDAALRAHVGLQGSGSVSWLTLSLQAAGAKYLMMTAASPASPLSQRGLLG